MVVLKSDGFLNLLVLGANPGVVDISVGVKLGKRLEALLRLTMVDQPTRRLGEEHDEDTEDDSGDVLDTQRDTPLPAVVVGEVVAAESNPGRDESTDTQHELLEGGDTTTDAGVCKLGLVQRDDHDEETNTETSDGTTSVEVVEVHGTSLETTAEQEEDATDEDCHTTTELVTGNTSKTRTEEGSSGEDRDDGTSFVVGRVEFGNEGLCTDGAGNDTQVITVEDGADGGKHGHQELYMVSDYG